MKVCTIARWIAPALLLATGMATPDSVSAQLSALRQAAQSSGSVAPPVVENPGTIPGTPVPEANLEAANLLPLAPVLLYGVEEQYRGAAQPDGSYRLESQADESNIKFFYADNPRDTYGRREIRANFEFDGSGSAGMIYGYQQNPIQYYLFLLDANETFRVLERTAEGFSEVINMSVEGGKKHELVLRENGSEVQISLNGQNMISLSNDRTGMGAVGLATIGAGTFHFRKFEILTLRN
ncbi:MAG: hypothetical protein JNL67_21260 [Planctomycetaceae bacterium]|nr:hypothetical protein [Planctomycetaceae bacterium]